MLYSIIYGKAYVLCLIISLLGIIVGCKKGFFVLISADGRSSAVQSVTEHDIMGEGGGGGGGGGV